MAAAVVIELDTTAPALVLGPATYPAGTVRVAFTVDEAAVLAADFVAPDGTRTPGVIDGTAFVFEVGLTTGTVEAEAIDLVGNRSITSLRVGASVGRLMAYATNAAALALGLRKIGSSRASTQRVGSLQTSHAPTSESEVSDG